MCSACKLVFHQPWMQLTRSIGLHNISHMARFSFCLLNTVLVCESYADAGMVLYSPRALLQDSAIAHASKEESCERVHMSQVPLDPVREQQEISSIAPVWESIRQVHHVKDTSNIPTSNLDVMHVSSLHVPIAAHQCSQKAETQRNSPQQPAQEIPTSASPQSMPHSAIGQHSRSNHWGSSLTAADLNHASSNSSIGHVPQHGHEVGEPTTHSAAPMKNGVRHVPKHSHGVLEQHSTLPSRSQPPAVGRSFDDGSPCLSSTMSHNVQSTFLPKTASPLIAQVGHIIALPTMLSSVSAQHAKHGFHQLEFFRMR